MELIIFVLDLLDNVYETVFISTFEINIYLINKKVYISVPLRILHNSNGAQFKISMICRQL